MGGADEVSRRRAGRPHAQTPHTIRLSRRLATSQCAHHVRQCERGIEIVRERKGERKRVRETQREGEKEGENKRE